MADRTRTIFLRMAIALPLLLAVLVGGCGSPRERYRVLNFFFDGVPNPDAPKVKTDTQTSTAARVITATVVSRHKPFIDAGSDSAKCDEYCHGRSGVILDFQQAYQACVKCHTKVSTSLPKMHGPVAREACKFCHAPHESTQPYLLKDDPVKVCTQCHDQQLLGSKPPEHLDGTTSCLNCHFGHGGHDSYFLKPAAAPPATVPAGDQPSDHKPLELEETPARMPATLPGGEGGDSP
jgi:predicted CXXCH cytochrome family protein